MYVIVMQSVRMSLVFKNVTVGYNHVQLVCSHVFAVCRVDRTD